MLPQGDSKEFQMKYFKCQFAVKSFLEGLPPLERGKVKMYQLISGHSESFLGVSFFHQPEIQTDMWESDFCRPHLRASVGYEGL